MKKIYACFLLMLAVVGNGEIVKAQGKLSKSDLIKLDFKTLAVNKQKLKSDKRWQFPAYKNLIDNANKLLKYKPVSVMQKSAYPPSNDKHDYMSIAPYWWPDPSKPGGMPYMRKDGEVNPEVNSYPDKEHLPVLCENVYMLALAYYFSDDETYAEHAGKLLKVWFIDTATRMNPNLNYGQAVKGVANGRAEGLIDTRHFIFLLDGVQLLQASKYWPKQDNEQLKQWFSSFLNWMQTSKIGIDEMNAKNNHGVWYDAQSLAIALYVDSTALANKIVLRAVNRLEQQMNNEGLFPLELERKTSLHYSTFLLNAFYVIAGLSEKTTVDFWHTKTSSGKSLEQAFNAIQPFIAQEKIWQHAQITPFVYQDAFPILFRSNTVYGCNRCTEAIKKIAGDTYYTLLLNLL